MRPETHDQNFKNLFLDFPREALEWLLPETLHKWGNIQHIEFIRQEPKKRTLSDPYLILDMPILFSFDQQQILLWLVEFQEDKTKFSIYKLLRYTTDLMEAYPTALVVPMVLFTDRKRWRKDVLRRLETKLGSRVFLHFEYVVVKLFDLNAKDYYTSCNPVIKILLPKMKYAPAERWEVIRQAYMGLFQLVSLPLFEKYTDFIDIYAQIKEDEREIIYHEIQEHEETVMIAQMLKQEGRREGRREGWEKGRQEGRQEGYTNLLVRQLSKKFQRPVNETIPLLEGLYPDDLSELGEYILDCESFDAVIDWLTRRKKSKAEHSGLN